MSHYLIDQNNQIITISRNNVNKSSVLSSFFKKYPKKAYKLDYPKKVIDQMVQVIQGQVIKNNPTLHALCQELDITIDDPEENYNEGEKNVFDVEPYVMGQAIHIFNSIYFKGNEPMHTRYAESRQPAQLSYCITIPKKIRFFSAVKRKLESIFYNIIYIDEEQTFVINKNEFKKSYSVLNDEQCVRNDLIAAIINNKLTCNERKYIQLVAISWNYEIVESIPEMEIIVDKYDIGSLINGNALGIGLNPEIFDIVVSLIEKQLKKNNSVCYDEIQNNVKYNQIIEIHRDYNEYIVKFKRIFVNHKAT